MGEISRKLIDLNIVDKRLEAFGDPFVFVVDKLFSDLNIHVGDVKIAKIARIDKISGYKIGKVGDHVALGYNIGSVLMRASWLVL